SLLVVIKEIVHEYLKRHRKIQSNKNNFVPNPIKTHVVCQFLYLLISLTDLVRKHLEFLSMADNLPHCQFLYLLSSTYLFSMFFFFSPLKHPFSQSYPKG